MRVFQSARVTVPVVRLLAAGLMPVLAAAVQVPTPAAARPDTDNRDRATSVSPVVWPVDGAVLRAFQPPATRYGTGHRGVDLDALPGDRVVAAMDGHVSFAGAVAGTSWVTVDHGGGLDTTYGELDPRVVTAGTRVRAGQVLGYLGEDATHLDWGARRHGEYLDPLSLLGRWRVRLAPIP